MMTNQKRRSVVTMALKLTPTQTDTDTTLNAIKSVQKEKVTQQR